MATRQELLEVVRQRYHPANRNEKGAILNEFVAVTGYHRKHALRLLNSQDVSHNTSRHPRSRIYDEAVREALVIVWETSDRICGKRLKAALRPTVDALERNSHLHLDPEVRTHLMRISASTIDRLLTPVRAQAHEGSRKRNRSNGLIRSQIPVRTFADWGQPPPGFMEADLVAHNGGCGAGSFVHTLVLTDIASGWTECAPLIVREQGLVVEAVSAIQSRLPFPLLGLDTDNDGAFINECLLAYAKERELKLTRSRAYRKNDQAWVEQKNGAVVRRWAGYGRLEGLEAARTLSRLYEVGRLYVNCFQPSFKLKQKQREGAKVIKHYDPPATPCDRLLASQHLTGDQKERLETLRASLDPLRLLKEIRSAQATLAGLTCPDKQTEADPTLTEFLAHLPTLWHEGEVRPTHRRPAASPRYWRTRSDPFADVWTEIKGWLAADPDITAKALLARLQQEHSCSFSAGQLRTLQRRVREWRQEMARKLIFSTNTYDADFASIDR
jgi:hypothetical protein